MLTAKQLRTQARAALKGRYWWAFLASLIAGVLGGVSGSSGGAASGGSAGASSTTTASQANVQLPPEQAATLFTIATIILVVALISLVVLIIIGGAVELGYNRFNISLYEINEKPPLSLLFSRFGIFGKALWLRVQIIVRTLLWSLLFIVPGIIASYRYAMAPYVLAENPEISASEAIEKSKQLMAGNKWRLFCLHLSFIGWFLLGCLTCGIGLLFLPPYVKAAETAFYLNLTDRQLSDEAAPMPEAVAQA